MARKKATWQAPSRSTGANATAESKPPKGNGSTGPLDFNANLWLAADKLRNNMDTTEYKHAVLGLVFLKYLF